MAIYYILEKIYKNENRNIILKWRIFMKYFKMVMSENYTYI